jgi:hypothetical protein
VAALAGLGYLALVPGLGLATHGGSLPAVVESDALTPNTASGTCRVTGVVQNPSLSETVDVGIVWEGLDATGARIATATARIRMLRPGEHRRFTSSAFVVQASGQPLDSCESIKYLTRLPAAAESAPVP